MTWIIIGSIVSAVASALLGYRKLAHLHHLNKQRFLIFIGVFLGVFNLLFFLHHAGYFPQDIAGATMAGLYSSLTGFLLGGAITNARQKARAGKNLYKLRSFITDIVPTLIGITLILLGIYRMGLFSELPFTPIRITSGLSIMMMGVWGFTLQPTPEFREDGIIIIDRIISWDDFKSYAWYSEDTIEIEYELNEELSSFITKIPADDQLILERVLSKKLTEKVEQTEE